MSDSNLTDCECSNCAYVETKMERLKKDVSRLKKENLELTKNLDTCLGANNIYHAENVKLIKTNERYKAAIEATKFNLNAIKPLLKCIGVDLCHTGTNCVACALYCTLEEAQRALEWKE